MGMIGIVEFDYVPADVVRGSSEGRAQRAVHISTQGRSPARILADPDIGREQADHRIHIAHI